MALSPTQQFSNAANIVVSAPNPNRNGTGPITTLVSSGLDGALVRSITIKSQSANTQGFIRVFINNGVQNFLYQEIMVPASVPSSVVQAFSVTINFVMNLQAGYSIGISTEKAETFSIVADTFNFQNCPCS